MRKKTPYRLSFLSLCLSLLVIAPTVIKAFHIFKHHEEQILNEKGFDNQYLAYKSAKSCLVCEYHFLTYVFEKISPALIYDYNQIISPIPFIGTVIVEQLLYFSLRAPPPTTS